MNVCTCLSTDAMLGVVVALSNGVIDDMNSGVNGDKSWTLVQPLHGAQS
jgi:hypothetical protein